MRLRARLAIAFACVLLIALVFAEKLVGLVGPLILALMAMAVVDPAVDWLERRGFSRAAAALLVIALAGALFASVSWLIAVNLAREFEQLRLLLHDAAHDVEREIGRWTQRLDAFFRELPQPVHDALADAVQRVSGSISDATQRLMAKAGAIPQAALTVVMTAAMAFFLVRDKRELGRFALSLMPKSLHAEVRRLQAHVVLGLLGYVKAQCILVAVSGALSIAGLLLFNFRYAWLLGSLAGILDLAPMVGPSGVFLPLALWSVALGDWSSAAGVAIVWATVLLVRQFLEPEIVGRHVGLHPLTSIVAAYFGAKLLGVNGLVLGPVAAVIVKAVFVVSVRPLLRQE